MMKNVMNIVNFVRGCEPRNPKKDLYKPVQEEIRINKMYGFKNTFLLQYDALQRDDIRELFLREKDDNMELGLWFEMNKKLTEAVGIPWRGRPGFDWDWYVNPGFLPAYTPEQRRDIIDEAFRLFFEIFGYYPRVAGSWILDAESLAYMSDKYEMDAFCYCREQYAVDAYTLWGGYYNGGYFPSRNNMLCPSQNEQTKIKTPLFRMLGIDPIYGYNKPEDGICCTLEPVWTGDSKEIVDWYLHEYYDNPSPCGGYATTGQENSFGWERLGAGYCIQAEKIALLQKSGKLTVETLGETGRAFVSEYETTPPGALSAFSDWKNTGAQSVWFSTVNYRANLFFDGKDLAFRDVQKFDDRYEERYLKAPCTEWQAMYDNLPIVDRFCFGKEDDQAGILFSDSVKSIAPSDESNEKKLVIKVYFASGHEGTIVFNETSITAYDCGKLILCFGEGSPFVKCEGNRLDFLHRGFSYSASLSVTPKKTDKGYELSSESGEISLLFGDKE